MGRFGDRDWPATGATAARQFHFGGRSQILHRFTSGQHQLVIGLVAELVNPRLVSLRMAEIIKTKRPVNHFKIKVYVFLLFFVSYLLERLQGLMKQGSISAGLSPGHSLSGNLAIVFENSRKILQLTSRSRVPSPQVTEHGLQSPAMKLFLHVVDRFFLFCLCKEMIFFFGGGDRFKKWGRAGD